MAGDSRNFFAPVRAAARRLATFGRLRTKIIVAFCALMVAGGTVTTAVVSYDLSSSLRDEARQRAHALAVTLASQLARPVADGDARTVRFLVETESEHTAFVVLVDPRGEIVQFGSSQPLARSELREIARHRRPGTVGVFGDRAVEVPATLPGNLGRVHVGISLEPALATTAAVARRVLMATGAAAVVGILGILLLASVITRPIGALMEASLRMGRGDLDATAPVTGSDELAMLARTFNDMAAQIRRRMAQSEEQRAYYERILDQMPSGVVVCDLDRRIEYASSQARQMCGAAVGSAWPDSLLGSGSSSDAPGARGEALRRIRTTPAGRTLEIAAAPMVTAGNSGSTIVTVRDVTETHELARRLQRAERLAVAGEIAAGIVHAINNPLDGVSRALDLARRSPADAQRVASMLEYALEGTARIAAVTRTLLSFARADDRKPPVQISPNLLAEEATNFVALKAEQSHVSLTTDLAPDVPGVLVDPRGIVEVLVNLLVNALDATRAGGKVVVRTLGVPDGTVEIAVADDGVGIPPELSDRIFEPFFTTKEIGRGTGLGLSVARRVVESYGGEITVDSTPGNGATFRVRLPRALQAALAEVSA
ncbi:MAG: HAMP domain-containing protein [Deltaproteobacteria bacterium]|nr:HAMP domain-containing protein [Deltaproteobacteria bacterium]